MIYEKKHSFATDYFTVEKNENLTFPSHMHSCFEIIAITSGEMTVEVGGQDYILNAGDIIFVFPYQMHSLFTKEHSSHTLCIFSGKIIANFYNNEKGKIPKNPVMHLKDSPLFSIFKGCSNTDDINKIKGIMYLMCAELSRTSELIIKSQSLVSHLELLDKIFTVINEKYTENCTLKTISEELKYDYFYISKIFTSLVGMSFKRYINNLRISEACYMLKNTDKTVIAISEQCGFTSLRSFNRNFGEIAKTTPTKYRLKSRSI